MMERILSVGNDEQLLATRLSVLNTRWSAKAGVAAETLKLLREEQFDLLVVCHTVPEKQLRSLVHEVRKNHPEVRILALEVSSGSIAGLEADAIATTAHGPQQMLERIASLLRLKNGP
jgi:DNA-binding response OmpR family regulator